MACVTDTPTVDLTIDSGELSADVNVSATAGNELVANPDGLYVGGPSVTFQPGMIFEYGAATAPTGYLLCNGQAVNRSTYAALFAVIGTTYGIGDGSVTFNVPDFQGRMSVGIGTNADVNAPGANEGISTVANRRPKHRTTITDPGHIHTAATPSSGAGSGGAGAVPGNTGSAVTGITAGTGNANDSLDTSPYLVVGKIIKT